MGKLKHKTFCGGLRANLYLGGVNTKMLASSLCSRQIQIIPSPPLHERSIQLQMLFEKKKQKQKNKQTDTTLVLPSNIIWKDKCRLK